MLVSFRNRPARPRCSSIRSASSACASRCCRSGSSSTASPAALPPGERRFAITKAFVGGDAGRGLRPLNEQFAAARLPRADRRREARTARRSRRCPRASPSSRRRSPSAGRPRHGEPRRRLRDRLRGDRHRRRRQRRPQGEAEAARRRSSLTFAAAFGPAALSRCATGGAERFARRGRRSAWRRSASRSRAWPTWRRRRWTAPANRRRPSRRRRAGARAAPAGEPAGPRQRCRSSPRSRLRARDVSRYRYLPWVREGAAHAYDKPDTLAPGARAAERQAAPGLPVASARQRRDRVDVPLRLYGPGRRHRHRPARRPPHRPARRHTADFEPNYLACIEFDIPDFPWLFTPAAAGANGGCGRGSCSSSCERGEDVRAAPDGRTCRCRRIDAPASRAARPRRSRGPGRTRQVVEVDASQPVEQILASQPERRTSRGSSARAAWSRRPTTSRASCRPSRPGGRPGWGWR